MSNLTYFFATLFLIAWAVGFFVFHIDSSIHLVLVFSLLLFFLRIISGKRMLQQ